MYGELAYQAGSRAMEFRDAGIEKAEILYELTRIERIITEQILGSEKYSEKEHGDKVDEILDNIAAARKILDTVYPDANGGGK